MAQQGGILKIKGSVGDLTFSKTKNGYLVQEKRANNRDKMFSDKAFQRTRENMAEFGRAGKGGKTLRTSIRVLLQNAKDSRAVSRLVKVLMAVIKGDAINDRGARTVQDGEIALLLGFDFNSSAVLTSTFFAKYRTLVDRPAGMLQIDFPSFVPADVVVIPDGATHFKLVSAGVEIDFENEKFVEAITETAVLPWDPNPTATLTLSNQVTANSVHPLFLLMGIQFYQQVNGKNYPLKNGAFNALTVIEVDR